jgi:TIR domain
MTQPSRYEPRIYISYRREDTAGHASRLYDALAERVGADRVVMDIHATRAGQDYSPTLERSLGSGDVLIALIGRHWLTAAEHGLEEPDDLVRREIETALENDVRVIPTLVQGAAMPRGHELPEPLGGLARRHAFELTDLSWDVDVEELLRRLEDLVTPQAGLSPPEPTRMPQSAPAYEPPDGGAAPRRRNPFRWWSERRGQRTAGEDEITDLEQDVE